MIHFLTQSILLTIGTQAFNFNLKVKGHSEIHNSDNNNNSKDTRTTALCIRHKILICKHITFFPLSITTLFLPFLQCTTKHSLVFIFTLHQKIETLQASQTDTHTQEFARQDKN